MRILIRIFLLSATALIGTNASSEKVKEKRGVPSYAPPVFYNHLGLGHHYNQGHLGHGYSFALPFGLGYNHGYGYKALPEPGYGLAQGAFGYNTYAPYHPHGVLGYGGLGILPYGFAYAPIIAAPHAISVVKPIAIAKPVAFATPIPVVPSHPPPPPAPAPKPPMKAGYPPSAYAGGHTAPAEHHHGPTGAHHESLPSPRSSHGHSGVPGGHLQPPSTGFTSGGRGGFNG